MTDRNTYYGMSKWQSFVEGFRSIVEGFRNISYTLRCYKDGHKYGYYDFWEALNWGYFEMYIFPYDDWFNPTITKERQLRLGQRPKPLYVRMYRGFTGEYIAFEEGGYTICAQPDREKADRCLEYYKFQHPDATFYGTWDT